MDKRAGSVIFPSTVATLAALSFLVKLCSGNYTLEVLLESYSNPSHKLADESCCNDRISDYDCQTSICSNLFVFCVRPYGYLPSSGQEVCPDISEVYKTFVIKDDNITFTDKQVFNSIKHISNPLKFSGNVWPGQVQVYVRVYNWNTFGEHFIDDIIQTWSVPQLNGSYSRSETFGGQRGSVKMTARIRVACSDNYNGPYCSHFCGMKGCLDETAKTTMAPLDISTTTTEGNPTSIVSLSNGGLSNEVERNQKLVKEPQVFTDEVSDGNSTISGRTVGGIVGGVLVGALTIVLLSFLIALCLCHRKRRVAEEQAIKGTNDKQYRATAGHSRGVVASLSGTYRRINNNLYSQVPSRDGDEFDGSASINDLTNSTAALRPTHNEKLSATNPLQPVAPVSSQYSIIRRRDSDVSTCHSEGEEGDSEEVHYDTVGPVVSQYSVVTRDNMDYVSEASDSEGSQIPSDTELVKKEATQKESENENETSDIIPEHVEGQNGTVVYENIPYNII